MPPKLTLSRPAFWFLVAALALGLALLFYGHWWASAYLTGDQQRHPLRLLLVAYTGLVGGTLGHLVGLEQQQRLGPEHSGVVSAATAGLFTFALCITSVIGLNTPSQAEEQAGLERDWAAFEREVSLYLGSAGLMQVNCPYEHTFPVSEHSMCFGSQQEELVFAEAARQLERFDGEVEWEWQASAYSDDVRFGESWLDISNPHVREGGDHFQMFYGYRDADRWVGGKWQTGGPNVRGPDANSAEAVAAERENWLRWKPYRQYLILTPIGEGGEDLE